VVEPDRELARVGQRVLYGAYDGSLVAVAGAGSASAGL